MIQRIQSVHLLLAAACAALMFFMPVYGGTMQDGSVKEMMVSGNFLLFLLAIVLTGLPFITIFLFKNRPLQMRLVWLSILIGILTTVMVYLKATDFGADPQMNFKTTTFKVSAALPVASVVFLFMAFVGIRKDEKMVRSLDKLR